MKRFSRIQALLWIFALNSIIGLPALAAERVSLCLTNNSGDVFTNLSVGKVLGDGLLLENSAGQFKVKFGDLPAEIREKYQAKAMAAAERERIQAETNARFVRDQQNLQRERDREQSQLQLDRKAPTSKTGVAGGTRKIAVPNEGWAIGILDCGFGRLEQESSANQFVCRGLAENGLNLSIFVEKPQGSGTGAEDVYKYYWPKASRNPLLDTQSVKVEKKQNFVKVAYVTLGMPNVNFYFAHKGKWVDVHISMLSGAKAAESVFADFESRLSYGN